MPTWELGVGGWKFLIEAKQPILQEIVALGRMAAF
jgi:hypothetical protein